MPWDLSPMSIMGWESCSHLCSGDWDIWCFPTSVTLRSGWSGYLCPKTVDAYKHWRHEELPQNDLDSSLYSSVNHRWSLQLHKLQVIKKKFVIKALQKRIIYGFIGLAMKARDWGIISEREGSPRQEREQDWIPSWIHGIYSKPGQSQGLVYILKKMP